MASSAALVLLPLVVLLLLPSLASPQTPFSSQVEALLDLRAMLEYPPLLSDWNNYTAFCYIQNSTSASFACSNTSDLTFLSIVGNRSNTLASRAPLSSKFSLSSLFSALSRLPTLRSLTLVSLGIWGELPPIFHSLPDLCFLNLSSNFLYGNLPPDLASLRSLQRLDLSANFIKGNVPDLSGLRDLQELNLSFNKLGPEFPIVPQGILRLVLRNNSFKASLPLEICDLRRLEWLDVGNNRLFGSIPSRLLGMPSVRHMDLSGNSFTGALKRDLTCGTSLEYVDFSMNKLVGSLPACLTAAGANTSVSYEWNCLVGVNSRYQHATSYCSVKPFAAVLPGSTKQGGQSRAKNGLLLMLGIAGGMIVVALLLALVFVIARRNVRRKVDDGGGLVVLGKLPSRSVSTAMSPSKVPIESRRTGLEVRVGTFDLKPYQVFTLQELEEMTNDFDPSNLIHESLDLKVYRGRLEDGYSVTIKCLAIKHKHSTESMHKFLDAISKLRHRNLVSILGHCIKNADDHMLNPTSIYLVFELLSNGTLRSHLTEWRKREMLKWPQRITAIIGVARGIHFLHNGTAFGVFGNDINIDNILLDKALSAKIDNYSLPKIMLSKDKNNKVGGEIALNPLDGQIVSSLHGTEHGDKEDIYQLGLILLEVITGKPPSTSGQLETLKIQLQRIASESSPKTLKDVIDPTIEGTFAFDSLKTAVDVALNCLCKNLSQRPSIDDILWNLQYSLQIQDAMAGTEELSGQF